MGIWVLALLADDFFGCGEIAATAEHFVHSDRQRVAGVAELLEAGYRDRVLLSQDVVTRMQLAEYGVDVAELRRLMTENPARWLTWR